MCVSVLVCESDECLYAQERERQKKTDRRGYMWEHVGVGARDPVCVRE